MKMAEMLQITLVYVKYTLLNLMKSYPRTIVKWGETECGVKPRKNGPVTLKIN